MGGRAAGTVAVTPAEHSAEKTEYSAGTMYNGRVILGLYDHTIPCVGIGSWTAECFQPNIRLTNRTFVYGIG